MAKEAKATSLTPSITVALQAAIGKFEARSERLTNEAWVFLALVLVLLIAGAAAVVYAKDLTAGDIGALSLDEKISAEQSEMQATVARVKQIEDGPVKKCNDALALTLQPWQTSPDALFSEGSDGSNRYSSNVPTGDKVVELVVGRLARFRDNLGGASKKFESDATFIPGCGVYSVGTYIAVRPEQLEDFKSKLQGKTFASPDDAVSIRELASLLVRRDSLSSLASRYNLEKIEADLERTKRGDAKRSDGGTSAKIATARSDDLFLTLLQTSVTRFGLLAVIGFFVSILVSLYRYNIRLAAFYTARADALRLFGPEIEVADFVLLSSALSPTVEFGKTPQSPVSQLVDLLKSAKESAK